MSQLFKQFNITAQFQSLKASASKSVDLLTVADLQGNTDELVDRIVRTISILPLSIKIESRTSNTVKTQPTSVMSAGVPINVRSVIQQPTVIAEYTYKFSGSPSLLSSSSKTRSMTRGVEFKINKNETFTIFIPTNCPTEPLPDNVIKKVVEQVKEIQDEMIAMVVAISNDLEEFKKEIRLETKQCIDKKILELNKIKKQNDDLNNF